MIIKQACFSKTQNKNLKFKIEGQSIIEVIVALALIAAVVLGMVKVTITSINNANFARDQRTATQYAQEGLENARKCKEENEAAFWSKSCPELSQPSNVKFIRTMTYTVVEAQQKMNVLVEVVWQDSKGDHKSSLQTNLTKW